MQITKVDWYEQDNCRTVSLYRMSVSFSSLMKNYLQWLLSQTPRTIVQRQRNTDLLRNRSTFSDSESLMVSEGISKLGRTELIFVDPGVKIYGQCYRDCNIDCGAMYRMYFSTLIHDLLFLPISTIASRVR